MNFMKISSEPVLRCVGVRLYDVPYHVAGIVDKRLHEGTDGVAAEAMVSLGDFLTDEQKKAEHALYAFFVHVEYRVHA